MTEGMVPLGRPRIGLLCKRNGFASHTRGTAQPLLHLLTNRRELFFPRSAGVTLVH